jgi:hypothetical protein
LLTGQRVDQKSITTAFEPFNRSESFTGFPVESFRSNSLTGAPIFAASPWADAEAVTADPRKTTRKRTLDNRGWLLANFVEITSTSRFLMCATYIVPPRQVPA